MFNILVVDDDKNTRRLMKLLIEEAGYTVCTAADGDEALMILGEHHIDLIILDVMMPGMDGYELTNELRASDNELPIIMVSAKQLPEDIKKGFRAGVDDYMTKPVDEEELILRIKALLRRAKIANDKKIILGETVFDYDSMTVTKNGNVMEVPQKEFQLIYLLLSNPGKIFTRIQLMDEIWGMESETGWETVTVHIGRLRKRFEDFDEFEIQSVRGLGYRVVKKI